MLTRGVGHILTWMNIMHYSPVAMEKFDVLPGETEPSSALVLAALLEDLVPIPGGKIEVHSLEVMDQIKGFLTGVEFTKEMVTFFNDKMSFVDKDDESDGDSECSAVYMVENDDAFDALPDVPDAPPHASRDGLPVPDVLPGASSEASPKPSPGAFLEASPEILPDFLPDVPGVLPVGLGVSGMSDLPGALPDVLPDALSVPETAPQYE